MKVVSKQMLVVGSRRELLGAALSMPLALSDPTSTTSLFNLLANNTPLEFRRAVAKTGRFLYRGESPMDTFKILAPEPDLLLPETYDDPDALAYFQCLEKRLSAKQLGATPSRGHIATSDVTEASQWGEAVSIWPLGTSFSYVWPTKSSVLFPPSTACPEDELSINRDLDVALKLSHEVLFASSFDGPYSSASGMLRDQTQSAFLAVPYKYEEELKSIIKTQRFRVQ